MTEKQLKNFYFPAWRKCAENNGWVMRKGRMAGARQGRCAREADKLYQQVWEAAEGLARAEHRAAVADDFRHGACVVAFGKLISAPQLSNAQTSRIVRLFKVLADPEDLDSLIPYLHPENDERSNRVWAIGHLAPFAYIDQICKDKFGERYNPPFWEDLEMGDLVDLHRTIKERHKHWPSAANRPLVPPVAYAEPGVEVPF